MEEMVWFILESIQHKQFISHLNIFKLKRRVKKMTKSILGINGLGRIGKLTLWHHIGRKHFSEIIVNLGRKVGKSLQDVAFYIEHDSTYGRLHNYL